MAKHIKCEAVKKSIVECCGDFTEKDAEYIIEHIPDTDIIEVVRCSECKNRYTMNCALWYSTLGNNEYFCGAMSDDNFFCAYGEMEDEGK
jgi:hypothetical protein